MIGNSSKSLLVIEDSDEDFEALKRIVRKSDFSHSVYRCIDGDDALDFLYREGQYQIGAIAERPSIILLDLNLPGTDGRDVLKQIKEDDELRIIPVIVFSTSSNPTDVEICYRYGVSGYILKPMDIHKLNQEIETFMRYWLEVVILPDRYDWTLENSYFFERFFTLLRFLCSRRARLL